MNNLETLKKEYETLRMSHNNKFGKADSLRAPASESPYRDSANALKAAHSKYSEALAQNDKEPLCRWV